MDKVKELLKEHGAVLIRKKKHEVWRLPNGKNFVIAQSASDYRAEMNNLSDLRKMLGITNEAVKSAKPKEYKPVHKKHELPQHQRPVNNDLANKLKLVGVAEQSLSEKLAHSEKRNKVLRETLDAVLQEKQCFFCRFQNWVLAKFRLHP